MKQLRFIIISLIAIFLIVSCAEKQQEVIEDITATYPDNAKVIFDNDYIKAVEFMLKPGDKLPMHKGSPRAVYALSDFKISWTEDEKTSEKEWKNGDTHWHAAAGHAIENIGESDAHYLVVSRKETALPATGEYDQSQDAGAIDTLHSNVILDNEQVRIVKTNIPAEESQEMHHGINRLIYALSDYQIKYTSDKKEAEVTQMTAGSAHWHNADQHTVENIGSNAAEYLIFAFKK
jgi:hypothetical protein